MKRFKQSKSINIFTGICLLVLGFSVYVYSQEHPSQEHPWPPKKTAKEETKNVSSEFSKAVESYIKETIKSTGTLPVRDIGGKNVKISGELEFVRIHKEKIVLYKDNTYFACADFIAKSADVETNYDLDFFMAKTKDGWKLNKLLLHKINGELQMTYRNNEPSPLEKGHLPSQEHP